MYCRVQAFATKPFSSTVNDNKDPFLDAATSTDGLVQGNIYYGPLTGTFRRLKLFSLSSLALTFSVSPFIFLMETTANLPLSGRFALATVAIGTSSISTALVAWAGKPYVTKLRWLEDGHGVEMTTLTLRLHERITRLYDPAFLVSANRPMATWELAESFELPKDEVEQGKRDGMLPREETIAETMTPGGDVVGRWIVRWNEDGTGTCRQEGRVARHFNVHQELLDRPIR